MPLASIVAIAVFELVHVPPAVPVVLTVAVLPTQMLAELELRVPASALEFTLIVYVAMSDELQEAEVTE
jgi:hypothetical protein